MLDPAADLIVPWQPNEQKLCFSNAQVIGHGQLPVLPNEMLPGPWICVSLKLVSFFFALAFAVSCSSFSWCFWLFFLIAFPLLFWCVQHVKSCFDFHVVCTILAHVLLKFARFLIVIDVFMLDLVFCRSRCSSFSYAPRIVLLVVCTVLAAHWRRLNFRFV